jgi:AcrR family transcriptional regulator
VNKRSFIVEGAPVPDERPGRAEELLDAAARCFAHGGFHATTVAEISLEAGCSPGLLYRYFAGKEALVAALVEREADRTVAALEAARGSSDLLAALDQAAIATCWDDARSAALHVQIVAEAARGGSAVTQSVRRTYTEIIAALAATLRVGQEAGAVDDEIDADAAAQLLVAVVNGLVMLRAAGVGEDAPPPGDATRALLGRILHPAREGQYR